MNNKKTLDEKVASLEAGGDKPFTEQSELSQVMIQMDSDIVDPKTLMSTIDFNSRLSREEISASLIFDEFVRLGILPSGFGLTRQKKRLSVSLEGKGREEKVAIVNSERENKSGMTMGQRFANLFKPQQ